jgi:membrane protease YdiL (CAAX protease family)
MSFRLFEFIFLFIALPLFCVFELIPSGIFLFFFITLLWCVCVLFFDSTFDKKQLWNQAALRPHLKRILTTYIIACSLLSLVIYLYDNKLLFIYIREIPLIWVFLMIIYSVFFVYPQELIYRTFFFHRYKNIFSNRLMMIGASAIVFSYMHIIFQNAVAIVLTLAGGVLFAKTYSDTKSTFAASLEHALYGCFVFSAGLLSYFIPFNKWIIDSYMK